MKRVIYAVLALTLLGAAPSYAACVGSDTFRTCSDASGNNYTVNHFGNTTTVTGSNANGSNWNQTSNTYGNTTTTTGTTNGRSWNETQTQTGNGYKSIYGTDSNGNSYNHVCTPYGGCN